MTMTQNELGVWGQDIYKIIYKYVLKGKKRQWVIIGRRDYCKNR
ncbi:hypothetical protein SAMN05216311_104217 [Chitinophaga sp. CF418]|nr:hypothetical protein SAMN05216311_104217 [Chitinophaga sp. CF418]